MNIVLFAMSGRAAAQGGIGTGRLARSASTLGCQRPRSAVASPLGRLPDRVAAPRQAARPIACRCWWRRRRGVGGPGVSLTSSSLQDACCPGERMEGASAAGGGPANWRERQRSVRGGIDRGASWIWGQKEWTGRIVMFLEAT